MNSELRTPNFKLRTVFFLFAYCLLPIAYSLFHISCLYAFYEPGISAASLSMGSSGSGAPSNKNIYLNPAAIAFSAGVEAQTNYRSFFLSMPRESGIPGYIAPNIAERNISLIFPFSGVWGGLVLSDLSLEGAYSQSVYSFCIGGSLKDIIYTSGDEDFLAGISVKNLKVSYGPDEYTTESFSKYSRSAVALTGDFGVLYKGDSFAAGVSIKNFIPAGIGVYDEVKLPVRIQTGVSGQLSAMNLQLDVLWDDSVRSFDIMSSLGLSYAKTNWRLGCNLSQATLGFGVDIGNFGLDFAFVCPFSMGGSFMDASVGIGYKF